MTPNKLKLIHKTVQDIYPDLNLYVAIQDKHGKTVIRSVISNTKIKAGLRYKVVEYRSNRLELTLTADAVPTVGVSNHAIIVSIKDSPVKLIHSRFVMGDAKVKAQLKLLGVSEVRVFSTDLTDSAIMPISNLDNRAHYKYCKYCYVVDPSLEIDIDLVTQAFKLKGII